MDMVSPHLPASRVHGQALGRKNILPDLFPSCIRIFQRVLGLLNVPLLDSWTIPKIFKKRTNIIGRTIPQLFSRPEINKRQRPFDMKVRTGRRDPILLQASLKSVPESVHRNRLVCIFSGHKTSSIQMVMAFFAHRNRQNKYITGNRGFATC